MNKFSDNRFMKAIEQIATNSVNSAIKNNAIAQAKTFGMAGAGLGALSGLGYTYFNKDEDNPVTFSDYMKNMLIGSGIGGASGAGIGALSELIPGYMSRAERINNIIQDSKNNGRNWASRMEEENSWLQFTPEKSWDEKIVQKMDDLIYDHNHKIRDKQKAFRKEHPLLTDKFDEIKSDLSNYARGTGKGEDSILFSGGFLQDRLGRIDAYINSGILNKHEADVVRNYVKDINPFDFTHDDLVNVTKAIESSQIARREKVIDRLYNYLSNKATGELK